MDLGEILRAWLSSDESNTECDSPPVDSSITPHSSYPDIRTLAINSTDCSLAIAALVAGYTTIS